MIKIKKCLCTALVLLTLFINSSALAELNYENGLHEFSFSGYMRGVLGTSEGSHKQAMYGLPGARSKYRLGNEADTNLELEFKYAFKPENDNKKLELVAMRSGYAPHGTALKMDTWSQAYFSLNDIVGKSNFWFGRRYYDRKDIHLMDHYWLNAGQNSHVGGGFEDIGLPVGTLDVALFEYRDKNAADEIKSHTLDARWRGLEVNSTTALTLWAQYSKRGSNKVLRYSTETGKAMGLWLDSESGNIKNTLSFSVQTGSTITQSDFNPNPVREDQQWNLSSASVYEINNALFYEVLPDVSLQASAAIRHEDRGISGASTIDWYSAGVRPIIYLSDHFSLAFEFGLDHIDDKLNKRQGNLLKETVALQFAQERGYYQRPVIRIFVTTAQWGDDFKGVVGNIPDDAPYGDETRGWSTGIQLEWWW